MYSVCGGHGLDLKEYWSIMGHLIQGLQGLNFRFHKGLSQLNYIYLNSDS